ncbi:cilia- and flagella- associated protein 210 [Pseudophryne corroboree]|uniref:cilia- and flagella- associated protein 210 n=1 Tax=Pseudophryne corroboree TaxID=495146 RepID=UPI00308217FE
MMAAAASSPVVQYGRRKGSNTAQQRVVVKGIPDSTADVEMRHVDLRQVTVLPKAEWERIVKNSNALENEARTRYEELKEREALHLRSKEVVKGWPNTISGLRQKRLKSKQLREEKEEAEKERIDLEEAQYQAEKRREAIEKAKTKLYYQNDKVRAFHSGYLLTEVLRERDAQMELKNKLLNMSNKQDKDAVSDMQRELHESMYNEQQRALQKHTERKKNAQDLLKQLQEHRHAAVLEKQANYKEGVEIGRLTRLHEWEINKLAKMKMDEKREIMNAHLAHVADKNFLEAVDKQKEEENDDMVRQYILAKKKMESLKRERELEVYRKTIERRDKITDLLAAQMKEKFDDEEQRTANAIAELERKSKKENQEKEEKIKADIKAITEHRLAMRKKKEKEEEDEKLRALQALHEIKEADNFFIAQQKEKMRRAKEGQKKVQTMQIQQMAEKTTMSQMEREVELEYDKQNLMDSHKEELVFQNYARQVIDSAIKAGKNPYPLKKAAEIGTGGGRGPVYPERGGIRPSYQVQDTSGVQLPAFQNVTTQEIKEIHDSGDIQQTKRRLGFTF